MPFTKGHKKIGGSVKGKASKAAKLLAKLGKEGHQQPLEFFIEVMNDKNQSLSVRLDAGKAAAPHIHRKMPTEIENTEMNPLVQLSEDELLMRLKELQIRREESVSP